MSDPGASSKRARHASAPSPSGEAASTAAASGHGPLGPASAVAALAAAGRAVDDRVSEDIARLQAEQKRMREERKKVANELRDAQKRKHRLKHRARLLSSEDSTTVIAMRETDAAVKRAAGCGVTADVEKPFELVTSGGVERTQEETNILRDELCDP